MTGGFTFLAVQTTVLITAFISASLRHMTSWDVSENDNDWRARLVDFAWRACNFLGLVTHKFSDREVPGLDRYPEDGTNPFIPFITKIVVPDEYAREQVALALRYLHDLPETDSDYMAVNFLIHMYTDANGDTLSDPNKIVIE